MRARRCRVTVVGAAVLAMLVAGQAAAGFLGIDLYLPMVGRNPGVYPSNWFTTVWIYNPNDTVVTVELYFLERTKNNAAVVPVIDTIAAGETKVYDNVMEDVFGRQGWGAIRIKATLVVMVSSRVFSKPDGEPINKSLGQDFPGVPASFAIGQGESGAILGVHQTLPDGDSFLRYNFGFVEVTGASATVRVAVFDAAGTDLGFQDLAVAPYSQRQFRFVDRFPAVSTTNSRIVMSVISGNGRVIGYGSAITSDTFTTEGTQDPTTFEMAYRDGLLAPRRTTGLFHGAVWSADGQLVEGGLELEITLDGLVAYMGSAGLVCGQDLYTLDFSDAPVPAIALDPDGNFQAMVAIPYDDGWSVVFNTTWTVAGQLTPDGVVVGTVTSNTTNGTGDWASCNGTVVRDWRGAWTANP